MSNTNPKLYERIGGASVIKQMVESFYDKLLTDYRLNRFFNADNHAEQAEQLTVLISAILSATQRNSENFQVLLDNFFVAAFSRNKRKSFVGGSDFGFFGYIIEQDHPSTNYLCDGHSHLLKFMPDNSHYDAVMEHLIAALAGFNLEQTVVTEILQWAEQARNPVLGN
jgi:hemoglobin